MNDVLPARVRWWQWPTVCSLDAPVVALLWQWLLAKVAHVQLAWPEVFVLGASVWLAYAADRWIEGWRLAPGAASTPRHRFYQRHRWPVATLGVAVLTADVTIAVLHLTRFEFMAGVFLLATVLAYLLSHQLVHRDRRWRAPKEICVAALLSGGVTVFIVTQPGAVLPPLLPPLALFALLCFANTALISAWEHEIDAAHGQTSLTRQFTQGAVISRTLPWMLALIALVAVLTERSTARTAAWCGLASSVGLLIVDKIERRLGWQVARVLADAVLMTPLAPLMASALRLR